ncbi:hypothetical protein TNCV_341851 [Trichonephila clavipes]|nr:hypothetical protein TNCV_341851 [Trichonephila clavipes]
MLNLLLCFPHTNRFNSYSIPKLKLDERGRLFPEGWEKKVNHDVRMDLIKKIPIKNGKGGRTPKHETLYRSRAPAGRGEERRKEREMAEGSKSRR